MMWTTRSDSRLFLGLIAALLIFAWLALLAWGQTPYATYLDHESLGQIRFSLDGDYFQRAAIFTLGWTLMTFAMMLPSTLPLIMLFRMIIRTRANKQQLTLLMLGAYLGIWALFGATVHVADLGIHGAAASSHWLTEHPGVLMAFPLLLAGGYQFTSLKYACLEKCRSPYSFITEHWRGGNERLQALQLGFHHGLFCAGCCWSLMLLMFAVGLSNVGWMLVLAAVMAIEKNMAWGRRISAPLGFVLVSAGLTVLFLTSSQSACAC